MPEKDDGLPVSTLREAIPYLRRPFTPEAVQFKIQTVFKDAKGCIVVGYIDARLVIERLNMVLADQWEARYTPVPEKPTLMWCDIMLEEISGPMVVTRRDVGEGQGATDGMRMKAAVSDSLKRAAVHFGVGVSVYALPQLTLWREKNASSLDLRGPENKRTLALTEQGHIACARATPSGSRLRQGEVR